MAQIFGSTKNCSFSVLPHHRLGVALLVLVAGLAAAETAGASAPAPGARMWFDAAYSRVDLCPCLEFQEQEQCVRRWEDLSGRTSATSKFTNPIECVGEYGGASWAQTGRDFKGIDFGQDDLEKPQYVDKCINGHYCIRGGMYKDHLCYDEVHGEHTCQDATFEVEPADRGPGAEGPFALAFLVRNVEHPPDWGNLCCGNSRPILRNDGSIDHRLYSQDLATEVFNVCPPSTAPIGEWAAVILARDQQNMLHCFTPSGEVGTDGPAYGPLSYTNVLSRFKGGGDGTFAGDIAAFGVWSRWLTESERQQVFARTLIILEGDSPAAPSPPVLLPPN